MIGVVKANGAGAIGGENFLPGFGREKPAWKQGFKPLKPVLSVNTKLLTKSTTKTTTSTSTTKTTTTTTSAPATTTSDQTTTTVVTTTATEAFESTTNLVSSRVLNVIAVLYVVLSSLSLSKPFWLKRVNGSLNFPV